MALSISSRSRSRTLSTADECSATALRWLATTSCSSRAILARSAFTAARRSISASRATCSARCRSASARNRYSRTENAVSTGTTHTRPATAPPMTPSAAFDCAAHSAAATASDARTVMPSSHSAVRRRPYRLAAYSASP